jgi:hypothetical protein
MNTISPQAQASQTLSWNMKLISHNELSGFGGIGEGINMQKTADGRRILWLAHESAPKNFTGVDVTDPKNPKVVVQTDLPHKDVRSNSLDVKFGLRDGCAKQGIIVLDCPISGTGAQAAAKDIAVYASGDEAAVKRCQAVFEGFARSMHYCGEFGNGSKLKFIANLLVTIHNLSAAEAIVLGRKSGLDLDLLYKVIKDGAGTSRMFEVRAPMMIADEYSKATMKVDVYQKDIDIIGDFAASLHCPTPLFEASKAYYAAALSQGRALDDTAVLCAVLEQMAGIPRKRNATRKKRKQ